MSWIIFMGLPGYFYKRKILVEIGGLIGKVAKLDMNMDNRVRDRFARMAVYVNLDKPLVNGKMQRVEYEFLPTICFHRGRYGHVKPTIVSHLPSEPGVGPIVPKNKPFNIPQSKVEVVKGPRNVDQVKKAITGLGLVSTIELGVNNVRVF
ncbi:hypothetical protein Golax_022555 [Gossypium laxum]|uniref:Uncharacterized protein n=1 Tax=Gossypium laxum TaxID=34288 RepID=A0A7J9AZ49_9ROSI|nr:hypothetical protein [Gossypium laxum]